MKVSARLGTAYYMPAEIKLLSKSEPRNPAMPHPITRDVAAIETAVAALLQLSKREAISRGLTPEQDLAAQQLRAQHGRLAALISDPITEAVHNAASILMWHLKTVVPEDERPASAERLTAMFGPETRYDADTRSRH